MRFLHDSLARSVGAVALACSLGACLKPADETPTGGVLAPLSHDEIVAVVRADANVRWLERRLSWSDCAIDYGGALTQERPGSQHHQLIAAGGCIVAGREAPVPATLSATVSRERRVLSAAVADATLVGEPGSTAGPADDPATVPSAALRVQTVESRWIADARTGVPRYVPVVADHLWDLATRDRMAALMQASLGADPAGATSALVLGSRAALIGGSGHAAVTGEFPEDGGAACCLCQASVATFLAEGMVDTWSVINGVFGSYLEQIGVGYTGATIADADACGLDVSSSFVGDMLGAITYDSYLLLKGWVGTNEPGGVDGFVERFDSAVANGEPVPGSPMFQTFCSQVHSICPPPACARSGQCYCGIDRQQTVEITSLPDGTEDHQCVAEAWANIPNLDPVSPCVCLPGFHCNMVDGCQWTCDPPTRADNEICDLACDDPENQITGGIACEPLCGG